MGKEQRIKELRASIPELTPTEAHERQGEGAVLIDVREPDEVAAGSPSDAQRIVRGFLELRVEDVVPDKSTPVLVMCAGGVRSLFASEGLIQLGYSDVSSVVGGFTRWKSDQLPVEVPAMLDAAGRERYQRHISIVRPRALFQTPAVVRATCVWAAPSAATARASSTPGPLASSPCSWI